jgi:hypothetical protein
LRPAAALVEAVFLWRADRCSLPTVALGVVHAAAPSASQARCA